LPTASYHILRDGTSSLAMRVIGPAPEVILFFNCPVFRS
jgi:hypothetical protein